MIKDFKFVPLMFVTLGLGSQIPLSRDPNPRVQTLRVQRKFPEDDGVLSLEVEAPCAFFVHQSVVTQSERLGCVLPTPRNVAPS